MQHALLLVNLCTRCRCSSIFTRFLPLDREFTDWVFLLVCFDYSSPSLLVLFPFYPPSLGQAPFFYSPFLIIASLTSIVLILACVEERGETRPFVIQVNL